VIVFSVISAFVPAIVEPISSSIVVRFAQPVLVTIAVSVIK